MVGELLWIEINGGVYKYYFLNFIFNFIYFQTI